MDVIRRGQVFEVRGPGVHPDYVRVIAKARGRRDELTGGPVFRCHQLVLSVDRREVGVQRTDRFVSLTRLRDGKRASQYDRLF
jgi:hypothetical protein